MSQYITPVTGRNSLTPSQSFRWLFLALERGNSAARPHRIEATAPNEHSARMLLVRDYILAFAGRLPVREVAA
ncbi:host cell division inhibitor Icd-like protein [Morganella morganii]